jgi:rare lipoprotein A
MIETLLIAALSCGSATYYGVGDGFHGRTTASGRTFNAYGNTAAHPYYRFGTRLLVTNQNNGKQTVVTVNDRGPYSGASIDLSYGAFSSISSPSVGRIPICYRKIT